MKDKAKKDNAGTSIEEFYKDRKTCGECIDCLPVPGGWCCRCDPPQLVVLTKKPNKIVSGGGVPVFPEQVIQSMSPPTQLSAPACREFKPRKK